MTENEVELTEEEEVSEDNEEFPADLEDIPSDSTSETWEQVRVEIANLDEIYEYFLAKQNSAKSETETHYISNNGVIAIKHEIALGDIAVTLSIFMFLIFQATKHMVQTVWRR